MNLTSSLQDESRREDILKNKHRFGLFFGMVVGFAFAGATWGSDALILNRVHAYLPWLKLLIAILICVPTGGLAGWLSAKLDKTLFSVLFWLVTAAGFAWLSAINTFRIFPALLVKIQPSLTPFVEYPPDQNLAARVSLAFVWTGIFGVLIGLLQLPLSDGAVFASTYGPKLATFGVAILIMAVCGFIVDSLNNEPLRLPVISLSRVVDFAIETRGQDVDVELARSMRRYAVQEIEDWLDRPYSFVVSSFDREIGQVHILANFGGDWADCTVVYNQTSFCEPIFE